jgi:solute carrier family 30 (zinc transporter), member 5/7
MYIAIHMAFDCMAIGVGLFASVMATWDPNERFTYGYLLKIFFATECTLMTFIFSYGRIETLSGFANGIFLILISIFIIFEAIQRMYVIFFSVSDILSYISYLLFCSMEPPEMNTNQLLLVSSLGLGVNLFGMFAMGGHHHHVSSSQIVQIQLFISF